MMEAWRLCSLLKNKKVVTILLWYVTSMFNLVYSSVSSVPVAYVSDDWSIICRVVLFLSVANNFVFMQLLDYLPMPLLEDTD